MKTIRDMAIAHSRHKRGNDLGCGMIEYTTPEGYPATLEYYMDGDSEKFTVSMDDGTMATETLVSGDEPAENWGLEALP